MFCSGESGSSSVAWHDRWRLSAIALVVVITVALALALAAQPALAATVDAGFENGADGAALGAPWTLSGVPQHAEYDTARAIAGAKSGWITGPTTAGYAGVYEAASAGMTSSGAEQRFWVYVDTANQYRQFDDFAAVTADRAFTIQLDTLGQVLVYTNRTGNPNGYATNAYTAVGTYAAGWTEFRVVYDFSTQTYQLSKRTTPGGAWTQMKASGATGYGIPMRGVNTVTQSHGLLARAYQNANLWLDEVAYDNAGIIETDVYAPSAPGTLLAADAAADQGGRVDLSWTAASDNVAVTAYKVYRGTTAGSYGAPVTLPVSSTSYTDSGLSNGTRYYYAVAAVDAAGNEGPKSAESSAIPADNLAPAVPSGLTATGGDKSVALSWTANADSDLAGYNVYRNGAKANTTLVTGTTFADTGRADGTTYTYTLKAVDVNGNESLASASATATTTGTAATLDGTFETGTDGAALAAPWVVSGTPQRTEFDNARAKAGSLSAWIQGPAAASYGGVGETVSGGMTANTAEQRFWVYMDTANQFRVVDDWSASTADRAFSIQFDTAGNVNVYTNRTGIAGYTANAYTAVGTYAAGWTEYRIVYNFASQTYTLSRRASSTDAWTGLKASGAAGYAIPFRGVNTITSSHGMLFRAYNGANMWLDDVAFDNAGLPDGPTPDTTAPTAPTALAATDKPGDQGGALNLTWTAATDNVAVTGYKLYRGTSAGVWGAPVSLPVSSSYTDAGCVTGTRYYYAISAIDAAGNESALSTVADAVAADNLAPAAPTNLTAVGGTKVATLSWTANTESDLAGYNVYRNGTKVNVATVTSASFTDTGLAEGTTYTYTVRAVDSNGNESPASAAANATTVGGVDTTAPSVPTAGAAVDKPGDNGGSINLSWAASTDNVGVMGYKIYRGTTPGVYGAPVTVFSVTSYTDATAVTGTRYYYAVAAFDAAGNNSALSTEFSATAADNLAPAAPTGLAAVGGTAQVSLSWTANTDSDLAGYNVYRSGVKANTSLVTSTSFVDTGRPDGTTYSYTIKAVDTSGNESAASAAVNATTNGQAAAFDGTFENGADGAALATPWTISGSPQRFEFDNTRAKNGVLSGWIQGPTTAAYAGGGEKSSVMTSNGAEHRFWIYADTANQYRVIDDWSASTADRAFSIQLDTLGSINVYTSRTGNPNGYATNAYTSVGTYAVGWTEYRIVYDFSAQTYTLSKRSSTADAWTQLKAAGATGYAIPMRGTNTITKTNGLLFRSYQNANMWLDDVRYADAGIVDGVTSYTVLASAGTGGSIAPSGSQTVNAGSDSAVFTIAPDSGYEIADVLVDGASVGKVTTYKFTNVTANHTISASFSPVATSNDMAMPSNVNCDQCHAYHGDDNCVSCHPIFDTYHPGTPTQLHTQANVSSCSPCHQADLTLEHKDRTPTAGGVFTCYTCHQSTNPAVKAAMTARNSECSACHADGHATSHAFTAGSDAVATGDAGCTNSGSGCHGDDASRASFGIYHPNTGCTDGACHTSASKSSYAENGDCQTCHDGTFVNAPARANLSSEHYNETTHTAGGMTATVSSGGTASATCADCHNPNPVAGVGGLVAQHSGVPAVAGSTYGTTVSCVECHNDTRANGGAEVIAGWTSNACADCHSITSSAPQHGTTAPVVTTSSSAGCGASGAGCHQSYDVHALHKDAAGGCSISGCHDTTKQAAKPELKTCGQAGGCHAAEGTDYHVNMAAGHASPTTPSCFGAGCHNPTRNLADNHALYVGPGSEFPQYSNSCQLCHANDNPNRINWTTVTSRCVETCHTSNHTGMNAGHTVSAASSECSSCHGTDLNGAHGTYDDLTKCGWCHDKKDNFSKTGDCKLCHTTKSPAEANHYSDTTHTAAPFTAAAQGTGVYAGGQQCSSCHSSVLTTAHSATTVSGGSITCVECHTDTTLGSKTVVTSSWPAKTCTACHTSTGTHAAYETSTGIAATHKATSTAGCGASGTGCHNTYDLGALHAAKGCMISGCHAVDKNMKSVTKTCGETTGCHATGTFHAGVTGTDTKHSAGSMTLQMDTGNGYSGNTCADCHSAALKTSHLKTGPTSNLGWTNECTDCHNSTSPVNGSAVAKASWPTKDCQACHTTSLHSGYSTGHQGQPTGTNTCSGCHTNDSLDLRVVHKGAITVGSPTDTGCGINGCHKTADAIPSAKTCGTGGACHTDKVDGNHGGGHPLNNSVSAYSESTDAKGAGCTNSGAGCHSTDTAGKFAPNYHPNAGCTTGACHTSAGKATHSGTLACQDCHDGTYAGAPARSGLYTSLASGGHYNETTHTAVGMAGTVSSGGSATATCADCHAPNAGSGTGALYTQHQGVTVAGSAKNVTCAGCHNASVAITAKVTTGLSTRTCADCHNASDMPTMSQHGATAPVVNTTSSAGCGASGTNCHTTYDVHALHKNAAGGCDIAGCHDTSKQGAKPSLKTCGQAGGCHTASGTDYHTNMTAAHTSPTSATCFGAGCHDASKNLVDNHALYVGAGSEFPQYATTCELCHDNDNANRIDFATATARCVEVCHTTNHTGYATKHGLTAASDQCSSCHGTDLSAAHGATGDTTKCATCHSQKDNFSKTADCTGCHATKSPTDPNHYSETTHTAAPFTAAAQGSGVYAGGKECSSCHSAILKSAHATVSTSGGSVTCAECHTDTTLGSKTVVAANWTAKTCTACHATSGVHTSFETSTGIAATHKATSTAGCGASGTGCHNTYDLGALHAAKGCTISGCHSVDKSMASASKTCGQATGCHATGTFHTGVSGNDTTHTATSMTSELDTGKGYVGNTCADCHTATMVTAHSKTGPTSNLGWTNECADCHNSTSPINGSAVVKSNWSPKVCATCHTTSHAGYASGHAGQPAGGNTCLGCHANDSTDLRVVHASANTSGSPTDAGCGINGCHKTLDSVPTAKTCGTGGACHTDKIDGNHGGGHPQNTALSTYSAATETGCTNSGSGCHGTDANAKFAPDYHPNAGCTTGPCHTSASKATHKGDLGCLDCHDGTFTNAPARSALATQHYNETTHTATGMTATVTSGGSASATCANCHNPSPASGAKGIAAQHTNVPVVGGSSYGSTVGCAECHNDTRANGNAVMLANWTTKTCAACHSIGSSAPQHGTTAPAVNATSTQGCGASGTNCHTTYDVHALHKNSIGGCALSGCHDFSAQGAKPTATTCGSGGACHSTYKADTTHYPTAKHAPTTTTQASATFQGLACSSCHIVAVADGGLNAEHALATSAKTVSASNVCLNCHNNAASTTAITNNWSAKDTTGACAACHTSTLAAHADASATAHTVATNTGCASTGAGCHNTSNLASVGTDKSSAIHDNCLRCHDRTATAPNLAYDPTKKTCGSARSCHTGYDTTTAVHNGTGGLADGTDSGHHVATMTASAYVGVYAGSQACSTCHSSAMKTAHTGTSSTLSSGTLTCANCHNDTTLGSASVVKANWTAKTCTACHATSGVHTSFETSTGIAATHKATSTAGCGASGTGCHNTYDLGAIHAAKGCTISGCHAVDKNMKTASKTCGQATGCHTTGTFHTGVSGNDTTHTATSMTSLVDGVSGFTGNACSDCHTATMVTAHSKTGPTSNLGWTNECTNCHNETTPINAANVVKTNWSPKVCGTCHTTTHNVYATGHAGAPTGTNTCLGCHTNDSTDLRIVHKNAVTVGSALDTGCGIVGCHNVTDSLPINKSCGTGGACHTDKADGNHGAATAHVFSSGSNYNNTTVAGCTNSGTGCHGSDTTFDNFASYHPTTGCTSGKCHTSASKATFSTTYSGNSVCSDCHNGNYTNAPDVVSLTAAAPNGHYNETSHTASGLTGTVSAGGTASAACTVCHSGGATTGMKALYGQHQAISVSGTAKSLTCSDCHNKNAAVSNIVTTKWTAKTCAACHTTSVLPGLEAHGATAPAVTATGGTYAGTGQACLTSGCHSSNNLHAIHANAAGGCTLSLCHDSTKQGIKPTGKSCGTTGTCHTAAEPHTNIGTAHDASAVTLAQPGSASVTTTSSATALSENFGTTTTWPSAWTRNSTSYIRVQTTRARSGAAAEAYATSTTRRTYYLERDIDLTNYQSATLTYWDMTTAFAGGSDYAMGQYSTDGGTTWTTVSNVTATTTWTQRTATLPVGKVVKLRFTGSVNATTEFANWDDVTISGVQATTTQQALPANSTALVSCQNNPNGTECHAVTDVRTLHSKVANYCTMCHLVGGSTKNCQTAGCHATQYINVDVHNTTNHATSLISTATGEPFAGTGVTSTTCTGCHDDSISLEHSVLTAYKNTPCSICHKKTTNSGAPTNVTTATVAAAIAKAAGTAECTDCHKTVTAASPHVQRMGTTTTLGSTQFDSTWSGHRVYDTMFGSRVGGTGSTFNGQATSITWSLPTATSWLKTGYTTTTMAVRCSDCHGAVTGATGPHGASMTVKIATGYDNSYSLGTLTLTSSQAMSNTTNICAKCHTTSSMGYNNVHSRSDHALACTACHVKTPHAWKRPRLIGYTTDPAPYRTTEITGITARSYTPTGWSKSYCGATSSGCTGDHPSAATPVWP